MRAPSSREVLAALSLSLLALTAACKDAPQVEVTSSEEGATITTPNGARIDTAAEGKPLELTAELPPFAPAYPGARLKTQITDNKDGASGGLLVFETDDPVSKVAEFYDGRAKEVGVKPAMIVNESDSAVRIFGGPVGEGRKGGALLAITRSEQSGATEIVITSGMAEDDVERMEQDKDAWRQAARPAVRLQ